MKGRERESQQGAEREEAAVALPQMLRVPGALGATRWLVAEFHLAGLMRQQPRCFSWAVRND